MFFQYESLHITVTDRLFSVSVNIQYLPVFLNGQADQFYQIFPGNSRKDRFSNCSTDS